MHTTHDRGTARLLCIQERTHGGPVRDAHRAGAANYNDHPQHGAPVIWQEFDCPRKDEDIQTANVDTHSGSTGGMEMTAARSADSMYL